MNTYELDYYIDPADMFSRDGESTKGVIEKVILPHLYPGDHKLKIILTEVVRHPEMLRVLDEHCQHEAMNCRELWTWVNDYTICELKDKAEVWRLLVRIIEQSIRQYFQSEQEPATNFV